MLGGHHVARSAQHFPTALFHEQTLHLTRPEIERGAIEIVLDGLHILMRRRVACHVAGGRRNLPDRWLSALRDETVNSVPQGWYITSDEGNASGLQAAIAIALGLENLDWNRLPPSVDEAEVGDATLREGHAGFRDI